MATSDLQAAAARRKRLMRIANVPMRGVLSLPFPTPLSKRLMLLNYVGRKSGKHYRQPLSYVRDGEVLLTPGGGNWTLSLADGAPVTLRISGHDTPAVPELVGEPAEVGRLLQRMAQLNPALVKFVPLPRGADGAFREDAVQAAVEHGFRVVRWREQR